MASAAPSSRRPVDRADVLVGVAAVAGFVVLVVLGLGLTFFADEWSMIADRSVTASNLLEPFNEHWLAATIVVYRAMLAVFGLHTYVPYLALLAALHVLVGVLVYLLVRRRTTRPIAVGIAVIVFLFGSGFENLFWGIQIDFVGATALGFGALLLLDDVPTLPGPRRAVAAAAMLTIAVMTSGYGLFVLALVGLDVLLDRRRWRWLVPLAVPAVLYVAWYLVYGRTGIATHGNPFTAERLAAVPGFVFEGASAAFGAAVGGGDLIGRVVVIGVVGWIVWLVVRRRTVPRRAVVALLAIAAQYTLVGVVRVQLGDDAATYTRYTYLSGMLALLCLASLVGRPVIRTEHLARVTAVGVAILIVSLSWNVRLLVEGRDLYAQRAALTRALVTVGITDPLPAGVDPTVSLVLVPSPVELRRVVARYGSPLTDSVAPGYVPAVTAASMDEAIQRAQHPPDPSEEP